MKKDSAMGTLGVREDKVPGSPSGARCVVRSSGSCSSWPRPLRFLVSSPR